MKDGGEIPGLLFTITIDTPVGQEWGRVARASGEQGLPRAEISALGLGHAAACPYSKTLVYRPLPRMKP
jgi:hypothetical protein